MINECIARDIARIVHAVCVPAANNLRRLIAITYDEVVDVAIRILRLKHRVRNVDQESINKILDIACDELGVLILNYGKLSSSPFDNFIVHEVKTGASVIKTFAFKNKSGGVEQVRLKFPLPPKGKPTYAYLKRLHNAVTIRDTVITNLYNS